MTGPAADVEDGEDGEDGEGGAQGAVVVIGAGVIGLTAALALAEAGHRVRVVTADDPADTCSRAAGAYWWPFCARPAERILPWAATSYRRYRELAQRPDTGVRMHVHYRPPGDDALTRGVCEVVDEWDEVDEHPWGAPGPWLRIRVPLIETPVFMPWLQAAVEAAGIPVRRRRVERIAEVADGAKAVVHCSGLGARALADDPAVHPVAGQVVRVRRPPELADSLRILGEDRLTLVLPRGEDVVLGGSTEVGRWDREPDPALTETIRARCAAVAPAVAGAEVLGVHVGLRPGRDEIRLERVDDQAACPVIHNYGHGGSGFTVAWGCAEEVVALVAEATAR